MARNEDNLIKTQRRGRIEKKTCVFSASFSARMRSFANMSSINYILPIVIISRYKFSVGIQSRTTRSMHWCHSQGNRRWRLAVQAISYTQLSLISEQNHNCSNPHAILFKPYSIFCTCFRKFF